MKILFGLLLLGGGLFAVLHFTGTFDFDPAQQAKDARAAIAPGMSWKKVVAGAGAPKKYCIYIVQKKMVDGTEIEFAKPGPEVNYDEQAIASRVDDGSFPVGFSFFYRFSNADAFEVKFDEYGDVTMVQDLVTMKDLLDL